MLTYTLAEFLETAPDEGYCTVYVARDGATVLYVGKATAGIRERWAGGRSPHVIVNGFGWQGYSTIGSLIVEHLPESRDWQIDLYTAEECQEIVLRHFPYCNHVSTNYAELALIQELRPLFNVASTGYEREIPAKFRRGPATATLAMDRAMNAA